MVPPQWSRALTVPAVAALTVTLAGCAMVDRDGGSTADGRGGTTSPGVTANRVSLVQKLGDDGPLRSLDRRAGRPVGVRRLRR